MNTPPLSLEPAPPARRRDATVVKCHAPGRRAGPRWARVALVVAPAWLAGCGAPPDDPVAAASAIRTKVPAPAATSARYAEGTATAVSTYYVDLAAGQTVTFETTAHSAGGDPVLHLFGPSGAEVAVDDDSAGDLAARLAYTAPTAGRYSLLVRAWTTATAGTCTLRRNGAVWQTAVPFGGWRLTAATLAAGEVLHAVRPAGGARSLRLYVLKANGLGIAATTLGAYLASYSLYQGLGTRGVIVAARTDADRGPARFLRNDPATDADRDGLGDGLEAALGTCSSRSGTAGGFECAYATDARDTDSDGIRDDWEVLGREFVQTVGGRSEHTYVPLAAWGASPRHKDLFLEVDTVGAAAMSHAYAQRFADLFANRLGVPQPTLGERADSLKNPDRVFGIAVHLDSGLPSASRSAADESLHGDWGGHEVLDNDLSVGQNWEAHLHPSRRGIFHYAVGFTGFGGSNGEFVAYSTFGLGAPGLSDEYSASGGVHEVGHTLGLAHSGRSLASWVDPNCKPTYPSLMNYGYLDRPLAAAPVSFSFGTRGPALNNARLAERFAVDPANTPYLDQLSGVFNYNVDRTYGHVDWDRDGYFSSGTVRAYANYAPGGQGCEWTRYSQVVVPGASTTAAPAVARLEGRTYLFYVDATTGSLASTYTTSSFNCPQPDLGCNGTSFSAAAPGNLANIVGVDAAPVWVDAARQLLVVATDAAGALWTTRLRVVNGAESWTTPERIADAGTATGEPSLASVDDSGMAMLAYRRASDGRPVTRLFTSGAWGAAAVAWSTESFEAGLPGLAPVSSGAAPGVGWVLSPGLSARQYHLAYASDEGFQLWRSANGTGRWTRVEGLDDSIGGTRGRTSLAWVPAGASSDLPGRLYVGYVTPSLLPFLASSYVQLDAGVRRERIGLAGPLDNNTFQGRGVDLLFQRGVDTNLRVADGGPGLLELRPKGDGVQDFEMSDHNDWAQLRATLCSTLMRPGGSPDPLVSAPVVCPSRP